MPTATPKPLHERSAFQTWELKESPYGDGTLACTLQEGRFDLTGKLTTKDAKKTLLSFQLTYESLPEEYDLAVEKWLREEARWAGTGAVMEGTDLCNEGLDLDTTFGNTTKPEESQGSNPESSKLRGERDAVIFQNCALRRLAEHGAEALLLEGVSFDEIPEKFRRGRRGKRVKSLVDERAAKGKGSIKGAVAMPSTVSPPKAGALKPVAKDVSTFKQGGEYTFEYRDVQDYYDIQIVRGDEPAVALEKTKLKFNLKVITVSPVGIVSVPGLPSPVGEYDDIYGDQLKDPAVFFPPRKGSEGVEEGKRKPDPQAQRTADIQRRGKKIATDPNTSGLYFDLDGTTWYYTPSRQWVNQGDTAEFIAKVKAGDIRAKLIEGAVEEAGGEWDKAPAGFGPYVKAAYEASRKAENEDGQDDESFQFDRHYKAYLALQRALVREPKLKGSTILTGKLKARQAWHKERALAVAETGSVNQDDLEDLQQSESVGEAEDLEATILALLKKNGRMSMEELEKATGTKRDRGTKWHLRPLNKALAALVNAHKVSATNPQWGDPSFALAEAVEPAPQNLPEQFSLRLWLTQEAKDELPPIVTKWAREAGVTTAEAHRRWKKAGELTTEKMGPEPSKESPNPRWWKYKTTIFKSMMGKAT